MEVVLQVDTKNFQKAKEILLRDDVVSRASIIYKDAKEYGGEGYYFFISGTEEQCKKAVEITKEVAKEVEKNKKEKIIKSIKEEEEKALEGFGGIFG